MKYESIGKIMIFVMCVLIFSGTSAFSDEVDHAQGEMAGEPTQTTVLLQSRLTEGRTFIDGDIPGAFRRPGRGI